MNNLALTSLLLGRIVGSFLIIWALFLMARRIECLDIVDKLKCNPTALYIIAIAILPISLTIVIVHPVWVIGWPVIITIIGWALVFSSLICIFFTSKAIIQLVEYFNKPASYIIHGIVSLVIGIYLVVVSFGL